METFRILGLVFIIVILYLIYKVRTKAHSKDNARFFNNLIDGEIVGETISGDYDSDDKRSVLSKIDRSINYLRENDWPEHVIEYDEKKKGLISKAFDNPESKEELIFHGGCLSCKSQEKYGIGRCTGCQYFTADWSLPNLFIK